MSTRPVVTFATLEHTDPSIAEAVRSLLFDGYTVEAEIIGRTGDFFPLRRTTEHIRRSTSSFIGAFDAEADGAIGLPLIAVAELEFAAAEDAEACSRSRYGAPLNIASFVVHPAWFQRGVGSALLERIRALHEERPVTVSTAAANAPAIALYEKQGFAIVRHWRTEDGIPMATLSLSR